MDYISREDAIKDIQHYGVGSQDFENYTPEQAERFIITRLNNLPPADVIEVIRCKECKYFNLNKWGKVNDIPLIVAHEICDFWGEGCKTDKDGYCSFAERRG